MALLVFNGIGALFVFAPAAPAGLAAAQSRSRLANVSPDSSFNTAISFVTNTNWQGYGGEQTMSYLTQMLALTVPELLLGRHRHRRRLCPDPRLQLALGQIDRQFLGRPDPLDALCAAAAVAAVLRVPDGARRDPEFLAYQEVQLIDPVTYAQPEDRRRWPADQGRAGPAGHAKASSQTPRPSPWDRSPRRKRSSCSAPMAAASSMRTRPTRTRTRRRCRTSCRCWRSS